MENEGERERERERERGQRVTKKHCCQEGCGARMKTEAAEESGGGGGGGEAKREVEGRGEGLEIRLLHRGHGWEKPKALVTFPYVNLGRCTFRPGVVGGLNRRNAFGGAPRRNDEPRRDSAFRCSLDSERGL